MDESKNVVPQALLWRSEMASDQIVANAIEELEESIKEEDDYERAVAAVRKIEDYLDLEGDVGVADRGALANLIWKWACRYDDGLIRQMKFMKTLNRLLEPPHVVGLSKHLTIEWKSLWEMADDMFIQKREDQFCSKEMKKTFEGILANVIKSVRNYLEEDQIDAVCEFAYSYLKNRLVVDKFVGQMILSLFLPSVKSSKYQPHVEIWMEEWSKISNCTPWDNAWLALCRRALKWGGTTWLDSSLVAQLHRRIQGALHLQSPSGYRSPQSSSRPGYLAGLTPRVSGTKTAAKLAVDLIGCGAGKEYFEIPTGIENELTSNSKDELASCLEEDKEYSCGLLHLRRLLNAIQTLFHPSNAGKHSSRVVSFAEAVCSAFAKKLGRERVPEKFGPVPTMPHQDKASLVKTMLPLITMAVYSKSPSTARNAEAGLVHLAFVAPISVYEHFIPLISNALDPNNLNMTHQAPAAIKTISALVAPLLQAKPLLAPVLPELLELMLPGIDPADPTKTMATFMCFQSVLSWIPIVDVQGHSLDYPMDMKFATDNLGISKSYGVDDPEKESQYDRQPLIDAMWRGSSILVEWSLGCLERILSYFDSILARAKKGLAAQLDNALFHGLNFTIRLLFAQMCPLTRAKAGDVLAKWALSSCSLDAARESKTTIRAYAVTLIGASDEEAIKSKLLSQMFEPLLGQILDKNTSLRNLEWSLILVGGIVRPLGKYILPYEKDLNDAIELSLKHEESKIRKLGGKLLRRVIRGLAEVSIHSRSSSPALDSLDKDGLAMAAVSWAQPEAWTSTCGNVKWSEPSKEQIDMGMRFYETYSSVALKALEEKNTDSNHTRKNLEILFQSIRGASCLLKDHASRKPLLTKVLNILQWALTDCESDTVSHRRAIKSIKLLLCSYGARTSTRDKLKSRAVFFKYLADGTKSVAFVVEALANCKNDAYRDKRHLLVPRFHQIDAIQTLHMFQLQKMAKLNAQQSKDQGSEDYLDESFTVLCQANEHDWKDTRGAGNSGLEKLFSSAPWYGKRKVSLLIPRAVGTTEGDLPPSEGRILGSSSFLRGMRQIKWIASDWRLLDAMMRGLIFDADSGLKHLAEDKQKEANDSIQQLFCGILSKWSTIPLKKGATWDDDARRRELMNDLSDPSKTSKLSWRQKMSCCAVLLILSRPNDTAITSDILKFVEQQVHSDMLPLRITACRVLIQLIDLIPEKKTGALVKQLTLDDKFYQVFCETLAQSHNISNDTVDGGGKQKADWSAAVGLVMDLVLPPGSNHLQRGALGKFSEWFHATNRILVEKLSRRVGAEAVSSGFSPQLKCMLFENVDSAEHYAKIFAAAEIFSGLVSHAPNEDLMQIVNEKFFDSSLKNAAPWYDAYRLSNSKESQQAILKVCTEKLETVLGGSGDMISDSVLICNLIQMIVALVAEVEVDSLFDELRKVIIKACCGALGNSFANVRESMAWLLHLMIDTYGTRGIDGSSEWIEPLVDQLLETIQGVPKEKESSVGIRSIDTVLRLAIDFAKFGGSSLDNHLHKFVPVVIDMQGHPNPDLAKVAKDALRVISGAIYSKSQAAVKAGLAITSCGGAEQENWRSRQSAVAWVAAMLVLNGPVLGYAAGSIHFRKEMEKLLRDPHVEVQSSASAMLVVVLSSFPEGSPSLAVTKQRYLKLANTKLKKAEQKSDAGKEKVKKRLTGVFGLAALVGAFPYTVPFPDAVVVLARRSNDSAFVGQNAKLAIKQFKHTHADAWEEAKSHFTTEELEDLEDTSYSGSHA